MKKQKIGLSMIVTVVMILVIAVLITVGIIVTNNNETNTDVTNNNGEVGTNDDQTNITDQEVNDDLMNDIHLIYTFKDPSKPVAFDYPNLKSIEEGTSQIFKNSRYVIAYCRDTKAAELKDIPMELSEKFSRATSSHLIGTYNSLSIKESKEININDIKVLMIKGLLIAEFGDGSKVSYPMQGYTFEKAGMIVELIGFINEESNDTNQKEMENTTEAMIKTLRDDR